MCKQYDSFLFLIYYPQGTKYMFKHKNIKHVRWLGTYSCRKSRVQYVLLLGLKFPNSQVINLLKHAAQKKLNLLSLIVKNMNSVVYVGKDKLTNICKNISGN